METAIIIFSIILFILLITSKDVEVKTEIDDNILFKDDAEKEPEFYHPVTGYKGTRSEMDAYIINREKKLKDK